MLWLSKHARLRNNLSPYIDGRLTASQATALKAHLAVCETCSRELDELRATATALNELPQAEAPRSFAITPEMLERKAAAGARPTPALGRAMRLAGAARAGTNLCSEPPIPQYCRDLWRRVRQRRGASRAFDRLT